MAKNGTQSKRTAKAAVLATVKRRSKPQTARQIAEAITSGKNPALGGKYAIANGRKVVYAMVAAGDLVKAEDGTVTLAQS